MSLPDSFDTIVRHGDDCYAEWKDGAACTCSPRVFVAADTLEHPHVPTSVYLSALRKHRANAERIKELETMLTDAWLACQAGRAVEDCLVIKVRQTRVESWRHALGIAAASSSASSREQA